MRFSFQSTLTLATCWDEPNSALVVELTLFISLFCLFLRGTPRHCWPLSHQKTSEDSICLSCTGSLMGRWTLCYSGAWWRCISSGGHTVAYRSDQSMIQATNADSICIILIFSPSSPGWIVLTVLKNSKKYRQTPCICRVSKHLSFYLSKIQRNYTFKIHIFKFRIKKPKVVSHAAYFHQATTGWTDEIEMYVQCSVISKSAPLPWFCLTQTTWLTSQTTNKYTDC